jgi:Phospholipase A2
MLRGPPCRLVLAPLDHDRKARTRKDRRAATGGARIAPPARMSTHRVILASLVLAAHTTACSGDLDVGEPLVQESVIDFGGMINRLGFQWTDYWSYGCYCGIGNAGDDKQPIDATDTCCKAHDDCWVAAPEGCDCATTAYAWYDEAGWIGCLPNASECAAYCCECDATATNCFAAERDSWSQDCSKFDRSVCDEDGVECCADADCDIGEVCFQGDCWPLCGGGDQANATGCIPTES